MSLRDSAFANKIRKLLHSSWMMVFAIIMLSSPAVFAVGANGVSINEFMANPVVIDDSNGEWIELKNNSSTIANVSNWTVSDANGVLYTFASLSFIEPNGYFVICADKVLAEANCDDSWGSGNLNNSSSESIILKDSVGDVVDELSFGPSNIEEGSSTELIKDNNNNTVLTTNVVSNYSQGNTGTPGANNNLSLPVKNITTSEEFNTIQEAIDDVNTLDGHTIYVQQGNEFKENLVINKELTIRSDNKWGTTIITQGAYRGVDIAADNVTLDGFKLLLPDTNQGTAWHLKISDKSNTTLKNIVMYGPGKNSGYTGSNSGITGIDINSAQNVVLDNVTVEKYNKNGISVTAKQSSSSTPSSNIKFIDIISRNNGKSDGWAGIALYTKSSQDQVSSISGVYFEGESLVAWNPIGLFIEGISGGTVSGNSLLDLDETKFENNKFDLVNAQAADAAALGATFDGYNGVNASQTTRDYIESQIWHDCEGSPYLTGECDALSSNPDLPSLFGSIEYAIDDKGPVVEDIMLNGKGINANDVRGANCEPIVSSYIIGGEIDLKAEITDKSVGVSSVKYKVRKVNSGGCTVSGVFSSGYVAMTNTTEDSWEDIAGFDTNNVPEDGDYTIMLQSEDSLGNKTTSYIDIIVDNTKPTQPQDITIKQDGDVLGCSALVNNRTITVDWGDSVDSNFKNYVYQADDTFGSIDYTTTVNGSQRSGNIRDLDGTYQYRVKATDMAGNESDWTDWCDVTLDRIAPTAGFIGLSTEDTSPALIGTVDDDSSSVEILIDGLPYPAIVGGGYWNIAKNIIKPLDVGIYSITVNTIDLAGNMSTVVFSGDEALEIEPITVTVAPSSSTPQPQATITNTLDSVSDGLAVTNTGGPNSVATIQGASTNNSPIATTDQNQETQEQGTTEVEGVTDTGEPEAGQDNFASTGNQFNWWWLLIIAALLIIGYGIYRFASEEDES